ncbi:MAG: hypothetical protein A3I63_02570 [Betaproteobacteria bacterium RIFCSPLOWO2_02_FULL_66_14]|nr:MAG: hypothetical protein A3I63_02570 [Betaproteobacteria bacterium RIFCSPLOWO2_02_FULL_66_14]
MSNILPVASFQDNRNPGDGRGAAEPMRTLPVARAGRATSVRVRLFSDRKHECIPYYRPSALPLGHWRIALNPQSPAEAPCAPASIRE